MTTSSRTVSSEFVRFAALGLVGTAVHYAVLGLATGLAGIDPVIGSTTGFIGGAVTNFLLAHHFAFRSERPMRETAWRFALVAMSGMLLNAALMYLLASRLQLHYFLAQLMATGIVLLWNFAGNKWWSFGPAPTATDPTRP